MDIRKPRKKPKKPKAQNVKVNVVKNHVGSEEKKRILEKQENAQDLVSVKDIKGRERDIVKSKKTFPKKHFVIGFILVIFFLALLFLAGSFLYSKLFRTEEKTALNMISEDAVFYAKIKISDNGIDKFYKLLKKIPDHEIISQEVSEYIQNELLKSGINFKKDLDELVIRNNITLAVVKNTDESKSKVLFLKVSDKNKVKDLIFNNKSNYRKTFSYKDFSIKTIPFSVSISEDNLSSLNLGIIKNIFGEIPKTEVNLDEISYTLIDDFIVISDDPRGIESVINTYKKENESIADSEVLSKYVDSSDENFCSSYIRPKEFFSTSENFNNKDIIGFSINIKDNGADIKTFSESSSELPVFSAKDDLLKSIPNESLFFYGSPSLSNDFKGFKESFFSLNSPVSNTIKGIESSLASYNFNLEDFIPTLDSNGYIFSIDRLKNNNIGYSIVLSLNNADVVKEKIYLLEKVLKKIVAEKQPLEKEIESSEKDLTPASLSTVQFNEVKLNDTTIKILQSQLPWEVAYAFYDNKLIISSSLDSVKNIVMASQGENRIADDNNFKKSQARLKSDANNIYFVNTRDIVNYYSLLEQTDQNEWIKKNLISVKNLLGVDYRDGEMDVREMFLMVE